MTSFYSVISFSLDMLFGNYLFEDYIGKLYMAAILEKEGQAPEILKMEVQEVMRYAFPLQFSNLE